MSFSIEMDRVQAVERYIEVQDRLPTATFPEKSIYIDNLEAITDDIDVFVLDGFGVINVGDEPVPDIGKRIANLQAAGSDVWVLTNGSSQQSSNTAAKYDRWGLTIKASNVVSSRDALMRGIAKHPADFKWGVAAASWAEKETLAANTVYLRDDAKVYDDCDAFAFIGASGWSDARQLLLIDSLKKRPRPLLVGNPDVVAPFADFVSIEPGYFSHQIQDVTSVKPDFYGKPFQDAFNVVSEKLKGVPPHRIAMVGDTLHTDILGGAAAGWKTVLVTDYGLLRQCDVEPVIAQCGIRPDYIAKIT